MIQPFLKDMTRSELHAVMTGGFATIAGGVLAAYISFGVCIYVPDEIYEEQIQTLIQRVSIMKRIEYNFTS